MNLIEFGKTRNEFVPMNHMLTTEIPYTLIEFGKYSTTEGARTTIHIDKLMNDLESLVNRLETATKKMPPLYVDASGALCQ